MRVFVLSTGRCGSTTFERACRHLTNFTTGHETRSRRIGDERFEYPDQHIESDHRLSWFLGRLGMTFSTDETLYVHLRRNPDEVAESFVARWDSKFRANMIRAFGNGIVQRNKLWDESDRLEVARFYVQTVNDNVAAFLAGQANTMDFRLEEASHDFPRFLQRIGAEGDLAASLAEWQVNHNARQ